MQKGVTQIVVSQDRQDTCHVWSGTVELFKNKMGMVIPRRTSLLVGRITKNFCKKLFGSVPRPHTAIRFEVINLGKVDIEGIGVNP